MSTRISTLPLWKSTAIPAIIQPFRIQLLGTHQLIYPCTYPRWRKVLLPSFCESLTSVPYARTSINTDRRTRRSRYVRFSRHIVGSMFHPRDLSWHKGTLCVRASPSSHPPTLSRNPLLRPTDRPIVPARLTVIWPRTWWFLLPKHIAVVLVHVETLVPLSDLLRGTDSDIMHAYDLENKLFVKNWGEIFGDIDFCLLSDLWLFELFYI